MFTAGLCAPADESMPSDTLRNQIRADEVHSMPRVLLIAWDGADWRILDPLLERGDLPNLQALIDRGQKGVLKSTIPTHSWAAWPSFLTGVDPVDHGVSDILEPVPGTHTAYPVPYKPTN